MADELSHQNEDLRRNQTTERQRICREKKRKETMANKLIQQKKEQIVKRQQLLQRKKVLAIKRDRKYKRSDKYKAKSSEKKNSYRRKKKNNDDDNGEYNNDGVSEQYLGQMDVLCTHCSARHFIGERVQSKYGKDSFNDCCSHGSILPTLFADYPKKMRQLFDIKNTKSNRFFQHIRAYNCALSFASFNANLRNFENRRAGPYCFIVQGQIYYQMNTSLYPKPDELPSYGQLFMIDSDEANNYRMSAISDLNRPILDDIDKILREHNIFAKSYYMMNEVIQIEEQKCRDEGVNMPEVQMKFNVKSDTDRHRYNPQRTNEVAAIFTTTADGEIPESYVTVKNRNDGELQYVTSMNPHIDPWIYPLFYPSGTGGYDSTEMRIDESKRISRTAYAKNLIAIRSTFNPILNGRKLFQQWIVDNYIKIEKDRTTYLRNNQKTIRSESYQGVKDYLAKESDKRNLPIGKMIILPSTFIGSPRYMAQNYQDAMAIVGKFGKPDLFITMTCNPHWREIQENLLEGQQPSDRPDLVARVFHLKKEYLLFMITEQNIFGEVIAVVYVVEFQKRGLPHVHILITFKRNYKLTRPDIIDNYISAEIPDPEEEPDLHEIVMQNMIHGPCGDWCSVDGKCSKKYPKSFQNETTLDEDGYPNYRRRNTEQYYVKNNDYTVDNRYVVPYSPEILRRLNCHCNVEVVSTIRAVKYLYKYIHKGHDAANVTIENTSTQMEEINHDEIKEHIEARYVGPVEASYRILSKKLMDKSHTVIRLPVHLPNQHNIIINPGGEECDLDDILAQKNMLLDYFTLNTRDENARKHLYIDIPSHYTFNKGKRSTTHLSCTFAPKSSKHLLFLPVRFFPHLNSRLAGHPRYTLVLYCTGRRFSFNYEDHF